MSCTSDEISNFVLDIGDNVLLKGDTLRFIKVGIKNMSLSLHRQSKEDAGTKVLLSVMMITECELSDVPEIIRRISKERHVSLKKFKEEMHRHDYIVE